METKTTLNSIALAVASVHEDRGWLCGVVSERDAVSHPLVPHITFRDSIPYLLRMGNLASATAPVFLPYVGTMNLFRPVRTEALDEFLRMKGDPAEAASFIKQVGVFALGDLAFKRSTVRSIPNHVIKWKRSLPQTAIPFATSLEVFWQDREILSDALDLWQSVVEHDEKTALSKCKALAPVLVGTFEPSAPIFDSARFFLSLVVARGLTETRFAAVESAGRIVPGVVTAAVRDAMFLRLMNAVSDGEILRKCAHTGCSARFAPGPHDKRYCSVECKDADKYIRRKSERTAQPTSLAANPQ